MLTYPITIIIIVIVVKAKAIIIIIIIIIIITIIIITLNQWKECRPLNGLSSNALPFNKIQFSLLTITGTINEWNGWNE